MRVVKLPPALGSVLLFDGERWIVTDVWPRLTPYRHAGQDTRVEGYTIGLVRAC